MKNKPIVAAGAVGALLLIAVSPVNAASEFSYMEPVASGVTLTPIVTAGDRVNGYLVYGVPDGIGVLRDGENMVLFVNHELSATDKVAGAQQRASGAAQASTISALNLDPSTMTITGATEALKGITWFDYKAGQYAAKPTAPIGAATKDSYGTPNHSTALNRFCSSSIVQPGDLAYRTTINGEEVTLGYTGPVYFTGEEGSDESRAFAMTNTGNMVQLPRMGLAAWENFLVAPNSGIRTVVMANEDGSATDSQVWMYVGEKTAQGSWADRAGLTNGQAYVMKVDGIATDNVFRASKGKNAPAQVSFVPIDTNASGAAQNMQARAGTIMARVEDGNWDPNNPNDYYFVTTESNKDKKATTPNPATPSVSRDGGALWRLRFNDVKNPLTGATLTMLLDGSEAPYLNKPDNITIDTKGNLLIQEDPGNNAHVSRLVAYRIADGKVGTVAKFKDQYFDPNKATQFITQDEESSGVTDVTAMMAKSGDAASYFVLDAQVHAPAEKARIDLAGNSSVKYDLSQTIEGGQIYVMKVTDWNSVYAS